jgi:hypothetical protein
MLLLYNLVQLVKQQVEICKQFLKRGYGISVPLPCGKNASICHKSIDHAKKTLGTTTSLDGNSGGSIQMMQEKAQQWINAVCNGHLHCQNIWLLLNEQFWLQIGYGL